MRPSLYNSNLTELRITHRRQRCHNNNRINWPELAFQSMGDCEYWTLQRQFLAGSRCHCRPRVLPYLGTVLRQTSAQVDTASIGYTTQPTICPRSPKSRPKYINWALGSTIN